MCVHTGRHYPTPFQPLPSYRLIFSQVPCFWKWFLVYLMLFLLLLLPLPYEEYWQWRMDSKYFFFIPGQDVGHNVKLPDAGMAATLDRKAGHAPEDGGPVPGGNLVWVVLSAQKGNRGNWIKVFGRLSHSACRVCLGEELRYFQIGISWYFDWNAICLWDVCMDKEWTYFKDISETY